MNGSGHSAEVAQAQGMVSAQVNCTVDEALIVMNARARTSHMTLEQVAAGIVHHLIRFDDE
ncbi:MAG TPA: ANTAR domain-containing protein [Acidimicrobiia bacterium]